MDRFVNDMDCEAEQLSPLTLAFVGDAVYELFVREMLACKANRPAGALHRLAVKRVKASAQSAAAHGLAGYLTEREAAVLRRGRNTHTTHIPKGSNVADYHYATGLEALFGYLYLKGELERLRELFRLIVSFDGADEI